MQLEVDKFYVDRKGNIRGPIVRNSPTLYGERSESCMWYENGRCLSDGEHEMDLMSEFTKKEKSLTFSWTKVTESGIWAFGGSSKNRSPVVSDVCYWKGPSACSTESWRCYLGPLPEINLPKKQVLWFVKDGGSFRQVWADEGSDPSSQLLYDKAWKTEETRFV